MQKIRFNYTYSQRSVKRLSDIIRYYKDILRSGLSIVTKMKNAWESVGVMKIEIQRDHHSASCSSQRYDHEAIQ
jgi:uracil phosphoribosyltransferase